MTVTDITTPVMIVSYSPRFTFTACVTRNGTCFLGSLETRYTYFYCPHRTRTFVPTALSPLGQVINCSKLVPGLNGTRVIDVVIAFTSTCLNLTNSTTIRTRQSTDYATHDPLWGSNVPADFKQWSDFNKVILSLFPWVGMVW